MQRHKKATRGARCWTRFLAGSTLALALTVPRLGRAELAPDDKGTADIQSATEPTQARSPVESSAAPTTTGLPKEEPLSSRGNCKNDYSQTCFQQGASRAVREGPEAYAQPRFQPGAGPPSGDAD